ncbi:MAG: glycerophosphodiester phosphodiesterase family protein [Armatimonadia bacterium]
MKPELMAHRGNSALAPENTLAAFAMALKTPSQWTELDVHLTADGEVVVMHDATVDRTTNGSGVIAEMTLAQIKALDAGSWFGAEFTNERVPTLAEVVDLVQDRIRLNVEIKSSADPESSRKVVEILRRGGVLEQSMISSFGLQAVLEVRQHWDNPYLALITGRGEDLAITIEHKLQFFNVHYQAVDEQLVAQAHEAGVGVCAWTIDDPALWRPFAELGVDIFCTNAPHLMPVQ